MSNLRIGSGGQLPHYALPLWRPRPRVASHYTYPLLSEVAGLTTKQPRYRESAANFSESRQYRDES